MSDNPLALNEYLTLEYFDLLVAEVYAERKAQRRKWGRQSHSVYKWLAILGEEYGEAQRAGLEWEVQREEKHRVKFRRELIQTAAVALAIVSSLTTPPPAEEVEE